MKTTTISVNVYEAGDVIEISCENLKLVAKQRSFADSTRAIIVGVIQRMDKLFTYKVLTDGGKVINLTPGEQGREKYVGHVDLSLLYGGKADD